MCVLCVCCVAVSEVVSSSLTASSLVTPAGEKRTNSLKLKQGRRVHTHIIWKQRLTLGFFFVQRREPFAFSCSHTYFPLIFLFFFLYELLKHRERKSPRLFFFFFPTKRRRSVSPGRSDVTDMRAPERECFFLLFFFFLFFWQEKRIRSWRKQASAMQLLRGVF